MTLGFYKDYSELFRGAVLHWTGVSETNLGFPTLPDGVTVTPAGTWSNPLDLGTNKILKTFNGSTNTISLDDNAAWNISPDTICIVGWFKFVNATISQTLVSQGTSGTNYWYLHTLSTGGPGFQLDGLNSTVFCNYIYTVSLSNATWYHVVLIKNGTSTPSLYVNGQLVNSVTVTTAFTSASIDLAAPFGIGHIISSAFLNGNIKDLIIFKGRALSLAELTTIMRLTHPTTGSGLLSLYPGVRGNE